MLLDNRALRVERQDLGTTCQLNLFEATSSLPQARSKKR